MKARVQKWGNSLAIRIPRAFASQAQLKEASPVDVSVVEGKIIIAPPKKNPYTLNALLAKVTDSNIHGEWDTGPDQGKEIL